MTNKAHINDRVRIKTEFSPEGITGRVIGNPNRKTIAILLDPKYEEIPWGFIATESDAIDYIFNPKYVGKRVGVTYPSIKNKNDYVVEVLPPTSPVKR